MIMWFLRRWFWNFFGWLKMSLNKPLVIPLPAGDGTPITPVPLREAVPQLPIDTILVCDPAQIPRDEFNKAQMLVYKLQIWLYSAFSPMQAGLPPIDADPVRALNKAYTWLHRTRFAPPELPAEYLGSPDLGSLAVRGPYACYLQRLGDDRYEWDFSSLEGYELHDGLRPLGVKVSFELNRQRRMLQAVRIDCALGAVEVGQPGWEQAKKLALCAASTHLSLVRHFNGVHLIGGAHLAVATRNQLPPAHPLRRLLWPYVYATQQSNDIVTRGQMLPGGDFETTFSFTFDGMCKLFEDSYADYRLVVNDPECDAKIRGTWQAGFVTPSQDIQVALFEVMHAHARDYLQLYYAEPHAVRNDASIGAWLDQLNALIPNGVGVLCSDVDFDSLARLVARFMYLVTVQHELLGSCMWHYQLWTHRQPVRVYLNGQREPRDVYQRLVNANYNLNVSRRALMHDFSYLALDAPGAAAMQAFQRSLQELQVSMERSPRAVWTLYPGALKVNINA